MRHAPTLAASWSADLPLRREADTAVDPGAFAAIAVLLALLVAAAVFAGWRRLGRRDWNWRAALRLPPSAAPLRVVTSTRLDARASLHVVEWEGSRLLVARGEQAITLLAERPTAPPERTPA